MPGNKAPYTQQLSAAKPLPTMGLALREKGEHSYYPQHFAALYTKLLKEKTKK
jgi:hypothetical protein